MEDLGTRESLKRAYDAYARWGFGAQALVIASCIVLTPVVLIGAGSALVSGDWRGLLYAPLVVAMILLLLNEWRRHKRAIVVSNALLDNQLALFSRRGLELTHDALESFQFPLTYPRRAQVFGISSVLHEGVLTQAVLKFDGETFRIYDTFGVELTELTSVER